MGDMQITTSDGPDLGNELPDKNVQAETQKNDRLLQITKRFEVMQTGWYDNFANALLDDKFVAGDQWDDQTRKDRVSDGRPVHTYNLLLTYCNHIVNAMRQNWPQIRVKPVDTMRGKSPTMENVAGTNDYAISDVYMGIIRNIEHQSRAKHAYDTAAEHQTQHGFGFWRLMPVYTRDSIFEQELQIKRVMNSYSVLVDPSAQEADFSDMQDGFVFTDVPRYSFKQKWPDAATVDFAGTLEGQIYQQWFSDESIQVAEYMWIQYTDDTICLLSNGVTCFEKDVEDVLDDLEEDTGVYVVKRRPIKRKQCMWQKMTAVDILQGPLALPFTSIPIFPVLGKELIVDGKVVYRSAIHDAKDAQLAFNYWKTSATETVALAPKAPWVLTPEQIEGHEELWEESNKKNLPFLLYRHIEGQPPPQRVFPQGIAAAELAQADHERDVMQDIIGLREANKGEQGNEKSGKAILARQARGDMATYTYPDNQKRAMEYMGRLMVEAIPRVYNSQRIVRMRMADDTEDFIEINQTVKDKKSGDEYVINDIGYGKYDVDIDTGPNFAVQREQAESSILELMQRLPPDKASLVAHMLVKNMDFPGADDVYRLLRKLLPDDLKTEDEREADLPKGYSFNEQGEAVNEEGEPLPEPKPDPEQQVKIAEWDAKGKLADASGREAEAKIAGAEADKAKHDATQATAQATIETAKATMAELTQNPEGDNQAQNAILSEVTKLITEAFKAHDIEVDEKITDAVVEVLGRVKKAMGNQETAPSSSEGGGSGTTIVVEPGSKVSELLIEQGENGLAKVIPFYSSDSKKTDRIVSLDIQHDENGELSRVVPEYENEEG